MHNVIWNLVAFSRHTGMKYSALVTSRTVAGTTCQADGELNKGEYNLWSDNRSFCMCPVLHAVEVKSWTDLFCMTRSIFMWN